ncbi:MAG: hypothetical protein M3203_00815 [Actinomycetota bacterium]|nr:hypothetical protein [Actinomycetota bacterium]
MSAAAHLLIRLAAVMALVLAACGGGPETVEVGSQTTGTEATTTTMASTASTTMTSTSTSRGRFDTTQRPSRSATATSDTSPGGPTTVTDPGLPDDPLRRRDVPPEGVPAQLIFSLPSRGGCDLESASPAVTLGSATYEIGDSADVCISGFDGSSHVSVEVTVPGGGRRHRLLRNVLHENDWEFKLGLADPTGPYTVTAVQGGRRATASFTAVLPRAPRLETLDPTSGPPGSVFRFAVVSPAPNQGLTIDLYRGQGRPVFTATLGTLVTDGNARATYQVPTRRDSPAGVYCLVARPFANLCASFAVR